MLRRFLAPLSASSPAAAPPDAAPSDYAEATSLAPTPDNCVYRREPPPPGARDVEIGKPQNFRLRAHVECDPNTGLYTGMDEFLTLAVSSKGRRRFSASASLGGEDAADGASTFDTAAAAASAFLPSNPQTRTDGASAAAADSVPGAGPARGHRRGGPQTSAAGPGAPTTPPPGAGPVPSSRRPPRLPSGATPGAVSGPSPPKRKSPRKQSSTRSLFAKPSMPTGVTHAVHVRLDPTHPTGFAGLPPAWETILLYSGIDKDEALQYPQAVVDVLNFTKARDAPPVAAEARATAPPGTAAAGDAVRVPPSTPDGPLPPIRFTFPRTPTVTSFDDASDHSVGLTSTSRRRSPSPPQPSVLPAALPLGQQIPDLVLAPPPALPSAAPSTAAAVPATGRSRAASVAGFPSADAADRAVGSIEEQATSRLARSMSSARGLGLGAQSLSRGRGCEPKSAADEGVNKENCARPLRPRSRSTGGGLAALASKCGADSVMAGTVQGSPASLSEDEMQKIIGGERGSHLPDCVPADAAALEIRPDSLHGLFSDITKIGEGSSGSVYRAVRRSDGMAVAVKQVKPAHERDWMLYRYEVHVMKSHADQETLVSCFDAFRDEAHLYMVLELMSASVADVLERRRAGAFNRALALSTSVTRELQGPASSALLASIDGTSRIAARKKSKASGALAMATGFEEGLIAYVCREVLRGLQQVHHISRVHRDIKSDNVLVRPDGAVKVADFGFCAELQAGARNTVVGTPYQMAPEVIRGKDYGTPVDIWSTGVLAYEMAEGVPPHEGLPPIRAMFKIATSDPPALGDAWSPELRDFVASCCKLDPSGRPSAPDALDHPFISRACSRGDAGAIFAALCADDA